MTSKPQLKTQPSSVDSAPIDARALSLNTFSNGEDRRTGQEFTKKGQMICAYAQDTRADFEKNVGIFEIGLRVGAGFGKFQKFL